VQAFDYIRPTSPEAALRASSAQARYIGGGTNLVDLMKAGVETPQRLIDVTHLGLDAIEPSADGGLRIGAAARNSDVANDRRVRENYPLLSQALLAGASPQLRNMATVGGNLMQRTRCDYFVDVGFAHCNKRQPGSGCAARGGFNRYHAILGASPQCVAVHPSDQNVALLALDAQVIVRGKDGAERHIALNDFHRLPAEHPELDTTLKPGELILAVELPPARAARHSRYVKVRERASYAFALVSAAAALEVDGDTIKSGRIALGSVAHKPWLAEHANQMLAGQTLQGLDHRAIAAAALEGAQPLQQNAYKIALAKQAVERALREASVST
jgi:xanthine dehydrogenase YagS FAD-binding subunit